MYKKEKVKDIFIKNILFLCFSMGILFESAKRFTEYCIKLLLTLMKWTAMSTKCWY